MSDNPLKILSQSNFGIHEQHNSFLVGKCMFGSIAKDILTWITCWHNGNYKTL